jgi:hypothetical protein
MIGSLGGFRRGALSERASEDGSRAASQSAIGKKKLVHSLPRGLAAPVEGHEADGKVRATSQNAVGKKIWRWNWQG